MKKNKSAIPVTTIVCLLPIILSLFMYDRLPEQVAIHFNFAGEADGYAPKAVAAFGIPVLMAISNVITNFMLEKDPKRENASRALTMVGQWTLPVISFWLVPVTLFKAMGAEIPIEMIVPAFVGVLIIMCGNYLPKCKPNYTVGIKLPWTLNSGENWSRTHHMAGYLWIVGGVCITASIFFDVNWLPITLIVALALAGIPAIYSYSLFKKGI